MNNKNANQEIIAKTMGLFQQCANEFKTKEELSQFSAAMAGLSIAMLRGIEGHEFADGFLHGAINEEEKFVIKPEFMQ